MGIILSGPINVEPVQNIGQVADFVGNLYRAFYKWRRHLDKQVVIDCGWWSPEYIVPNCKHLLADEAIEKYERLNSKGMLKELAIRSEEFAVAVNCSAPRDDDHSSIGLEMKTRIYDLTLLDDILNGQFSTHKRNFLLSTQYFTDHHSSVWDFVSRDSSTKKFFEKWLEYRNNRVSEAQERINGKSF